MGKTMTMQGEKYSSESRSVSDVSQSSAGTRRRSRPRWSAANMGVIVCITVSGGVSMGETVSALDQGHDRYIRRSILDINRPLEGEEEDRLEQTIFIKYQFSEYEKQNPIPAPIASLQPSRLVTNDSDDGIVTRPPEPTESPVPSPSPSASPTANPSISSPPTNSPTISPTDTSDPSPSPSKVPTVRPATQPPTPIPTLIPTPIPTLAPTTGAPTTLPSNPPIAPEPTPLPSTREPTDSPTRRPSSTPSAKPNIQPTATPSAKPNIQPTSTPSAKPNSQPTSTPSATPNSQPTSTPSAKPNSQPTSTPSAKPNSQPTSTPSAKPNIQPTPSPSPRPTTMSPTSQPSAFPSSSLAALPTPQPSRDSSLSPNLNLTTLTPTRSATPIPSSSPSIAFTPSSSPSPSVSPPVLPTAPMVPVNDIPLTPFEVSLVFNDPLSEEDVAQAGGELEIVVTDYLLQELSDEDFGDGVELGTLDLNVASKSNSSVALTQRRLLRSLQQDVVDVYTYRVGGTADFSSEEDTEVDATGLSSSLDASVNAIFDGPENTAQFTDYLRMHPDSTILQNSKAAVVDTQPLPVEEKTRPSTVSIVFGFLLVGLALLSLLFYAYTWWKGYKKRAAQRKRERQGVHATSTTKPNSSSRIPSQQQQQQQQSPPPVAPGFLVSSTMSPTREESSDDDSSYQGVNSETDSDDVDAFARELQLAASLDKRAWDDYQRKRDHLEEGGMVVGKISDEKSSGTRYAAAAGAGAAGALAGVAMYDAIRDEEEEDHENEDEGFEITDAGSTFIIGPTIPNEQDEHQPALSGQSFPYGDENAKRRNLDPPGPRSSSVAKKSPLKKHNANDPSGVRGSQLAIVSPISEVHDEGIEMISSDLGRSPVYEDSETDSENDPAVRLMDSLTANTGAVTAQARESPKAARTSPSESMNSIQSSQAVQMSQASNNFRASSLPSPSSPTSTSSNEGRLLEDEEQEDGDTDTEDQPMSKGSESLRSLLTIDIVKEVQKLSQFVQKYERKRQKEKNKEAQREEQAAVADASFRTDKSAPSVGYDALGEGALATNRNNTTSDAITGMDESDSDESSQNSGESEENENTTGIQQRSAYGATSVRRDDFEDDDDSSMDSEQGRPAEGSEDSRLGITPFNVQKIMAAQPDVAASRRRIAARQAAKPPSWSPVPKPVSKPPVTGNAFTSTVLSPIPGTPDTPEEDSPTKRRMPLDDISRNVASARSPDARESPRKSPRNVAATRRNSESRNSPRRSPRESPRTRVSARGSSEQRPEARLLDSLRDKQGSPQLLPPKHPTGYRNKLKALRHHDAILDADPDVMTSLAPSDEDAYRGFAPSDEERTRDGARSPSPSRIKITPRKSGNRGFDNILSMFEAKPPEPIFPKSENWQYMS